MCNIMCAETKSNHLSQNYYLLLTSEYEYIPTVYFLKCLYYLLIIFLPITFQIEWYVFLKFNLLLFERWIFQ